MNWLKVTILGRSGGPITIYVSNREALMSKSRSQRESGFNGGIKEGSAASGKQSKKTERLLRKAARIVASTRDDVYMKGSITGGTLGKILGYLDDKIGGMAPDGGLWFDARDNKLLFAAEAKRQGLDGNAIERWCKNFFICMSLGVYGYFTLCVGEGFFGKGSSLRILQSVMACHGEVKGRLEDSWNKIDGKLMFFRYRSAESITVESLVVLLNQAIDRSLATKYATNVNGK